MKRKRNRRKLLFVFVVFIILLFGYFICNNYSLKKKIINSYNEYVITNKKCSLYDKDGKKVGMIGNNIEIILGEMLDKKSSYFPLKDLEGYYIKYTDVDKIKKMSIADKRYLNYIPFNLNIVTNNVTNFYDENDNFVYSISKSFSFPIIIKKNDKYGVEFNNSLLYVKDVDVKEIVESNNTDKVNSSGIAVLNYHAFYDEGDVVATSNCDSAICHSKKQFKEHLDLIKEYGMLTLKMNEVEMYIDEEIQLPKSILITIDDGDRSKDGIDLLTEYKMYATIFLVTSWFDPKDYYKTDYIEFHSHSHHMHETGDCPIGQGGGIQCLDEETIQNDLKTSRSKLNNTKYFCYPFYEYNDYAIKMLKEAGFTMAFIGESKLNDNLIHTYSDKYKLNRFVIIDATTINDLEQYFDQIQ